MNYYETLYIVHPALEAGRLKDNILNVEKVLSEKGGTVLATDIWGKKKLAYYIDKQKYGNYVLIQFKSDGSGNNNYNIELEHNPNILAYMTIRIEEGDVAEDPQSIDVQLAGKDTSTSKPVKAGVKTEATEIETESADNEKTINEVETDEKAEDVTNDVEEALVTESSDSEDQPTETKEDLSTEDPEEKSEETVEEKVEE